MNDGVERGARRWAPSRGAVGVTWLLLPGSVWVSLTLAEGWRGGLDPKLGLAPEGLARAAGLQVPRAVATAGDEAEQGAHHRALPGQRGEARLGGGAGGAEGHFCSGCGGSCSSPPPTRDPCGGSFLRSLRLLCPPLSWHSDLRPLLESVPA